MCWELFEDFQKEIKEEISKKLGDCKYKITNYSRVLTGQGKPGKGREFYKIL